MKSLNVYKKHKKAIALQTLRYSDIGAMIMGGMTKDNARDFLLSIGYTQKAIEKIESTN